MTGLKSGSGDDLWDDDGDDESEPEREAGNSAGRPRRGPPDDHPASGPSDNSDAGDDSVANPGAPAESSPPSSSGSDADSGESQPYIIRRAIQDKSVQFERDERLTFFVRGDVAEGERDLITDLQGTLGRDVPKFDVREAVYRAALNNPDDVLEELLEMGYSIDDE